MEGARSLGKQRAVALAIEGLPPGEGRFVQLLRRAAATSKDLAAIGREAVRYHAGRAPEIVLKMVDAQLTYRIGPFDFFFSDLFNRPRETWPDYMREQPHTDRMLRVLHPPAEEIETRDKVTAAERVLSCGIPCVPTLAVVGRDPSRACRGRFAMLDTKAAVVAAQTAWPEEIFIKPASGSFGEGAMALTRQGDHWRDRNAHYDAAALADILLSEPSGAGMLVQPRLVNDPAMGAISSGRGLCATRIITALTDDGPEIVAVIHKMLGRDAIADNFSGGKTGNLICGVDAQTGQLGIAYGRAPGLRFLLMPYDRHPATGQPITDFRLPQWSATRRVALDVAAAFPNLPLLGHDIAITDYGPLFLETNTHWRISLPQLAIGGLRPVLQRLIPRLAVSAEKKSAALAAIG